LQNCIKRKLIATSENFVDNRVRRANFPARHFIKERQRDNVVFRFFPLGIPHYQSSYQFDFFYSLVFFDFFYWSIFKFFWYILNCK